MKKLIATIVALIVCTLPMFAQSNVGKNQTVNSAGIPQYLQQDVFPSLTARPSRQFGMAFLNATTATVFSTIGAFTASTSGTLTNAAGSDGNWINIAGTTAYLLNNSSAPEYQYQPRFVATIKTGPNPTDIQSCLIQAGFFNPSALGVSNPNSFSCAGFRYNPPTTDNTLFWRIYVANGTLSNVIITTYPIASNTEYTLSVDARGSTYYFYINNTLVGSTSTGVPGVSSAATAPPVVCETGSSSINIKIKNSWVDCN